MMVEDQEAPSLPSFIKEFNKKNCQSNAQSINNNQASQLRRNDQARQVRRSEKQV